jgi:hypothetical protein
VCVAALAARVVSASCESARVQSARAILANAWASGLSPEEAVILRSSTSYFVHTLLRAECDPSDGLEVQSMLVDSIVSSDGMTSVSEARNAAYTCMMMSASRHISDSLRRNELMRGLNHVDAESDGFDRARVHPAIQMCKPWAPRSALCLTGCTVSELMKLSSSSDGILVDIISNGEISTVRGVVTGELSVAAPYRGFTPGEAYGVTVRGCYASGGDMKAPAPTPPAAGCEGGGLASFFHDVMDGARVLIRDEREREGIEDPIMAAHDDMGQCDMVVNSLQRNATPILSSMVSQVVNRKTMSNENDETLGSYIILVCVIISIACALALFMIPSTYILK